MNLRCDDVQPVRSTLVQAHVARVIDGAAEALDRKYEQLTKRRGAIEREQAQLRSEAEPEAAFEPTPQANCRGIAVGARGNGSEERHYRLDAARERACPTTHHDASHPASARLPARPAGAGDDHRPRAGRGAVGGLSCRLRRPLRPEEWELTRRGPRPDHIRRDRHGDAEPVLVGDVHGRLRLRDRR